MMNIRTTPVTPPAVPEQYWLSSTLAVMADTCAENEGNEGPPRTADNAVSIVHGETVENQGTTDHWTIVHFQVDTACRVNQVLIQRQEEEGAREVKYLLLTCTDGTGYFRVSSRQASVIDPEKQGDIRILHARIVLELIDPQ